MPQKLEALFRRVKGRTLALSSSLTCILLLSGIGIGSAVAAPADSKANWILSVNGQIVAAAEDEDSLNRLYEEAVDTYRTDSVTSLQVLSAVQIRETSQATAVDVAQDSESILAAVEETLSVQTVSQVTETEEIPYGAVTVEDDSLYTDETYTVPGQAGVQTTTYSVVSINGTEKLRKQTGTATTAEPQDEVTYVGTKERNAYIWPAHGAYTGSYGIDTINGANRVHKGIDIAASAGTEICAARAGTVVYAGWNTGGFGNLVVIDHDNGTHTYYAHNSAICVSVGDTVEQGQKIAEMGATGRVTGVHCHFEIRQGNYAGLYIASTLNPMDYLDLSDL